MALTVTSGTGYLKMADTVGNNQYIILTNIASFTVSKTKIYFNRWDAFSGAGYTNVYDITDWATYNGVAPVMATIEADILTKATA